jgi:diguanylate cyclase (GGDEF)-like protein
MQPEDSDLLQKWLTFTQRIYSTLDLDEAVRIALDVALQLTGMERGFITILNPAGDLQTGRNSKGKTLEVGEFANAKAAVDNVIQNHEPFYFEQGYCIPLFSYRTNSGTKKIIGVLYADSSSAQTLENEEKEIVNVLAIHAGPALENALLYNMATRDPLTGLYQRHYFDSVGLIEWKRTVRHRHPISIIMVDLDNFKSFNEAYGWSEGDLAMKRTANILREACRTEDIISRYENEQFEILLPETDASGARIVAQRILEDIPLMLAKDAEHAVTASIGIASSPQCPVTHFQDLVILAQHALELSQQTGGNVISIYDPLASTAHEKLFP